MSEARPWRRWTSDEDAVLADGWRQVPLVDLAARLGRTQSGVHERARHLGLTARPPSVVRVGTVAREAGCDPRRVLTVARDLGLSVVAYPTTEPHDGRWRHRALSAEDAARVVSYLRRRAEGARLLAGG